MLVLTRRAGESVMIDGQIEIKVLRIRGSQVHLGIDAPADTSVHRQEVWVRLQQDAAPDEGRLSPGDVGADSPERSGEAVKGIGTAVAKSGLQS